MRLSSLAAFSLILAATPVPLTAAPTIGVAAAIAAPDRKPDNVKLDEGRKPAAVLQFLGLKSGMRVLDLFGANGYWAEIMVPVIGPKGHDTIWNPTQFFNDKAKAYTSGLCCQAPERHRHQLAVRGAGPAEELCRLRHSQRQLSRHLLENDKYKIPKMDPAAFLKAVYASMKPGAVDRGDRPHRQSRTTTPAPPLRNSIASTPRL